MSGSLAAGEARPRSRFVILPDRRSSIGAGILGVVVLSAGFYFLLGLTGILLTALGGVCVAYAILSIRGPSSLPRIEIDNQGIREVLHFGITSHYPWTTIAWFEPHVRNDADGVDYCLRIKRSDSKQPQYSELILNCYLPDDIRRDEAVTWIADWLDAFRQHAVSHTNAIEQLQHPKYLKGLFA